MSSIGGIGAIGNSGNSASGIHMDYMNLMITQLKNQNPLDPMDNTEMASQLTQLAQLEQAERQSSALQQMSSAFDEVLQKVQYGQAAGLLGKRVSFDILNPDSNGSEIIEISRTVESVNIDEGQVTLAVGDYEIGLGDILEIRQ